ncbi:GNAT family N-acetyltransferase [Aurantiacibacter rhizosphaerae]|uniref:GNAT family N-acetyltransferase n=1 Tax=Aurantiacibacter rhizosphaerae TaxID=2691582 RepID=A0A844XFJ2_9SPHN|nr:GNAT family N-acetyltransferase [Aurantiacibacter rhizosphaerae]MWV28776.1 GNAT family N-acetyltransferase [Aurantiacibacter rhizosphaerae]
MTQTALSARIAPAVGSIAQADWDRLAGPDNPFTSHAFLTLLEDSGSVGPGSGWQAAPLLLEDGNGRLVGALPSYLKGHSQGEYVFDHAWADAWERAGGDYYPKLQVCVPFTPATGPRLLLEDNRYAAPMLRAAEQLVDQNGWSGAHATFVEPAQHDLFEDAGWLRREDIQFHWYNRDYADFDGFLADLTSRKRKDLRKERLAANEGISIEALTGADIKPEHWDAFWLFYQDTGARKWGTPYLTREAFDLMGQRMADKLLLLLAFEDGIPIAGALNFIGTKALYGRYWGCLSDRRFLHFELCYYRAIDAAIELGLERVEAGAQGGHKLARGYEPVATVSMHYIADPGFRDAVEDFLSRERMGVGMDQLHLAERTPFKQR